MPKLSSSFPLSPSGGEGRGEGVCPHMKRSDCITGGRSGRETSNVLPRGNHPLTLPSPPEGERDKN